MKKEKQTKNADSEGGIQLKNKKQQSPVQEIRARMETDK